MRTAIHRRRPVIEATVAAACAASVLLPAAARATVIAPRPMTPHQVTARVLSPPPAAPQPSASTAADAASAQPSGGEAAPEPSPEPASQRADAPAPPPGRQPGSRQGDKERPITAREYRQMMEYLRLIQWRLQGELEELARAFIVAEWGAGGDSGWGAGTDGPDATAPSAADGSQDPDSSGGRFTPPPASKPNIDENPVAATADGLGDLVCAYGDWERMNQAVLDPVGGSNACF